MATTKNAVNRDPKRWMPNFLRKLAETGHVGDSAKYAHVHRNTAYSHKLTDPEFAAAWDAALDAAVVRLEDEAVRRAVEGVEKPIYQQGRLVGIEQQYSDTLLIFLLKANRPQKYREQLDITSGGKAIKAFVGFSPEEWKQEKPDDDEVNGT